MNLHIMQSQVNQNFACHALVDSCMPCKFSDMRINLKAYRDRLGVTLETMSERSGFSVSQLSRWESGDSNIPSNRLPKLAEAYGCTIPNIFDDNGGQFVPIGPTLYVKGTVAAGVWNEAVEWPQEDWQSFTGRADVTSPLAMRFGLRVEGESMNARYPAGTIVECVSFLGGVELTSGRRVVVVRKCTNEEYEATVKKYVVDADGIEWLVPESTHPAFQTPIRMDQPEDGILETRIIAVVVAAHIPE